MVNPMSALNCAGQGCHERSSCRRFVVRVNAPGSSGEYRYGAWASFDIERKLTGDCKSFVKYRAS